MNIQVQLEYYETWCSFNRHFRNDIKVIRKTKKYTVDNKVNQDR